MRATRWIPAAMAALFIASNANAIEIKFEDANPATTGGTIKYDGAGGAAYTSVSIKLDQVSGSGTPISGAFACNDCVLEFTTGSLVTYTNALPTNQTWTWSAGGSFTIRGAVPAAGIAANTLLVSGTFDGASMFRAGGSATMQFGGAGFDTKNPDLLALFGLGPDYAWEGAITNITTRVGEGSDNTTGAFTATVDETDFINRTSVPEPTSLGLLGMSLLGVGLVRRKRVAG